MAKQSSPPPADSDRAIPPRSGVSFSDEEIAALLRLARDKKSWWKDYSLLIAVLAFLLSLVTTMVSTWIGHLKDVHDQQTQLLSLTQDLQDLDLKSRQYRQQYSLGGPIFTSIAQQERAIHSDAVAVALGLGTNAPTGELIILALASQNLENIPEAKHLLTLAVAASRSALDKSYAMRLLGALQIRGGSPEMRAAGNANFQRAVDVESEYPDLQEAPPLELYIKVITESLRVHALMATSCNEALLHMKRAQDYLSGAPAAVRLNAKNMLAAGGVAFSDGMVLAPLGCSPTPGR
jgi:hypothetical protein